MKKILMAAFATMLLASTTIASASTDFWRVVGISAGVYLNMHVAPGVDAAVVLRLPPDRYNLIVDRCETRGGRNWCYVDAGGHRGWVAKHYIRQMTPMERKHHPYHPVQARNYQHQPQGPKKHFRENPAHHGHGAQKMRIQ